MAFRFSTKVRDDMLGLKATCNALYYNGGAIALNDNGASADSITDTGNGLTISPLHSNRLGDAYTSACKSFTTLPISDNL